MTRSTWPIRFTGAYSLLMVRSRDTDWEGVRLHVVTGKGGTGKTTVAAALALALAAEGGKVLLMEVEGRQGIAQLFDCPPLPREERKVAVAPGMPGRAGGDLYALAADPEAALVEYLETFYNLPHALPVGVPSTHDKEAISAYGADRPGRSGLGAAGLCTGK